jgi:hypothetical protein
MRSQLMLIAAALALAACSASEVAADGGPPDSGIADAGVDAGVSDAGPDAGIADGGADAGDTWGSYAMGFFQTYCVSCHSPTGGDPGDKNFTQYTSVVKYSALIRCGVCTSQQPDWNCPSNIQAEQFPIGNGPKPQAAERDRLVAWIDAGLPQ